jgi:aminopeptidase-like protein
MAGVDWVVVPSPEQAGEEMHGLIRELFDIPRSLTGDGVRETLRRIARDIPLEQVETPSGTQVFDWTLPPEWNIRDAWIEGPDGTRVLDFADSNLHVLGYSTPIRAKVPLAELREHVHTHPDEPDWIPYRTSYYTERWGFCMEQRRLDSLDDGDYEVCIDSTLAPGHVTYGEALIRGETDDEVLLSTYVCHPSLANDNLSGVVLLAQLGKLLGQMRLRYSYRLLWSPGTIGPLTWLWRNRDELRVRHGLVASCVGDPGAITYKRSRREDAEIDRAVALALRDSGREHELLPWFPWGGDERQFCSPGFDLPVGALSRTPADKFRGYHSSADDLDLVRPEALAHSLAAYLEVIDVLESNRVYRSTNPHGEPQLGKRGLYRSVGGGSSRELALLWVLNLADGEHDLTAIAERSGLPFAEVRDAAAALRDHDLLVEA